MLPTHTAHAKGDDLVCESSNGTGEAGAAAAVADLLASDATFLGCKGEGHERSRSERCLGGSHGVEGR